MYWLVKGRCLCRDAINWVARVESWAAPWQKGESAVLLPDKGETVLQALSLLEADRSLARCWGHRSEPQTAKWQSCSDEQYRIFFPFASLTLIISLDANCGELYHIPACAPVIRTVWNEGSVSWPCKRCGSYLYLTNCILLMNLKIEEGVLSLLLFLSMEFTRKIGLERAKYSWAMHYPW